MKTYRTHSHIDGDVDVPLVPVEVVPEREPQPSGLEPAYKGFVGTFGVLAAVLLVCALLFFGLVIVPAVVVLILAFG